MQTLKSKIFVNLTVYTLVLAALSFGVKIVFPALKITPWYLIILLFFYIITLIILYVLEKKLTQRMTLFANAFMLVNFLKLVIFTIIIGIYAFLHKQDAISFILTFFVYYVLFSIFEVVTLKKFNNH